MYTLTSGDRFIQGYLCQKNKSYSNNRSAKLDMWNSKKAQKHFEELKNGWDENCDEVSITETMSSLLEEIDNKIGNKIVCTRRRFLDVGSATGGFSYFMLNFEQLIHTGFGITLPVEKGGYEMLLEPCKYYDFMYADIVEDYEIICDKFNMDKRTFNLALCDATLVGDEKDPKKRKELLTYQLKLALKFLEQNGDLLIKLSSNVSAFNISVLTLLNIIFENTRIVKPIICHKIRSSYYLFCSKFKKQYYDVTFDLSRSSEDSIDSKKIDVLNHKLIDIYAANLAPLWDAQTKCLIEFRK